MAATQTASKGKLQFKPTKSTAGIRPNIPAGKWIDSTMPRGRFKVTVTKTQEPMLNIPIKLGRADDDENKTYESAEEILRIVFYDDDAGDKTRSANMSKVRLRALCEAVEVDYDAVYPASIESEDDFEGLIRALEGKKIPELWTSHRLSTMPSGEETININIFFKEPGSGLATREEEDETPRRANGKGKGRRS